MGDVSPWAQTTFCLWEDHTLLHHLRVQGLKGVVHPAFVPSQPVVCCGPQGKVGLEVLQHVGQQDVVSLVLGGDPCDLFWAVTDTPASTPSPCSTLRGHLLRLISHQKVAGGQPVPKDECKVG